jgi:beta-glucosidase
MVLLANDGILPLHEPESIAVIGEGARFARTQGGGSATVVPVSVISPLEGIRRRWPNARIEWEWGALVQQGVTEFEPGSYTTFQGEPGLLVRYLDEDENVLGAEVRSSSSLVWFDGASLGTASKVIEFSFRYTPTGSGIDFLMGLAGVAEYEVIADGSFVAKGEMTTMPGDDPSSVVLNPPSASVRIPMTNPSPEITVRFIPMPGDMPDALALKVGLSRPEIDPSELISRAAHLAARSEVAIVVVGTSAEVESEGFDRETLRLPGSQDEMVNAVAAVNPRTIVVMNSGAPVTIPWREKVSAVLATWFPGQEFGDAVADVVSGDIEPGGRLPMTWPADEEDMPIGEAVPINGRLDYSEGIHVGYRAWLREGRMPAYSFGHGLGYTQWELADLTATSLEPAGSSVSVFVENVGSRAGKCVAQFYLERVSESLVERPVRWLAGFQSLRLDSGESSRVEVVLPWRRFAHWESGEWRVEPGFYRVVAGLSVADDAELSTTIDVPPALSHEVAGGRARYSSVDEAVAGAAGKID